MSKPAKKEIMKFPAAKFQNPFHPSYIILRIQRPACKKGDYEISNCQISESFSSKLYHIKNSKTSVEPDEVIVNLCENLL